MSEMSVKRIMRNISRFTEEKFGLKVNMSKSKIDRPNGIKYPGFGFYYDTRAGLYKAKLHQKSVMKFKVRTKVLVHIVSKERLTQSGLVSMYDYYIEKSHC